METAKQTYPPGEPIRSPGDFRRAGSTLTVDAGRQHQVRRLGLALLFTVALYLLVIAFFAIQKNDWQMWVLLGYTSASFLALARLLRLRPSDSRTAMVILTIGISLVLIVSILVAETGLKLGLITVVLGVLLANRFLPPESARRAMIAGAACSLAAAGFDYLHPVFQIEGPVVAALPVGIGLLGLAFTLALGLWSFPRQPLATKTMLILLLVGLLPFGLAAFTVRETSKKTLTEASNSRLAIAAEDTAAKIDAFFSERLAEIETYGSSQAFARYLEPSRPISDGPPDTSGVESLLWQYAGRHEADVLSCALLDLEGTNLVDTKPAYQGKDESYTDYFRAPVLEGRSPFASPVKVFQSSPQVKAVLVFSRAILDESGRPLGVLRVKYDAHVLQHLVEEASSSAGPGSYAVLFDEYHLQLANGLEPKRFLTGISPLTPGQVFTLDRSERIPDLSLNAVLGEFPELNTYLDSASINRESPMARTIQNDGQVEQVAIAALSEKPWTLAFFQPHGEVFAPLEAQTRGFLLSSVISASLIVLVGTAVAGRVTQSMDRIIGLLNQAAVGDTGIHPASFPGEFSDWSDAFRQLTGHLRREQHQNGRKIEMAQQQLNTFSKIVRHIQGAIEPEDLLQGVVDLLLADLGYYAVQVFLLREGGERLELRASNKNLAGRASPGSIRLQGSSSTLARAVGEKRTIHEHRMVHDSLTENPQRLAASRSEACLPIIYQGRVLGVLNIQQNRAEGLSEADIEMLEGIAGQIAIGLTLTQRGGSAPRDPG